MKLKKKINSGTIMRIKETVKPKKKRKRSQEKEINVKNRNELRKKK